MVGVTPGLLDSTPTLALAVAEVLEETAIRIDREGFVQNEFYSPATDRYCTRGMFTQVVLDRYRGHKAQVDGVDIWRAVIEGCDLVLATRFGMGVAKWTDVPGRTKDEVVEALTKTAAELKAGVLV